MAENTDNHGFYLPETGEQDWGDDKNTDWEALDTAVVVKGTLSNRPAAGTEGRWYLATDEPELYYDDGGTWQRITNVDADTLDGEDGAHYLDHANFTNVQTDDHHDKTTTAADLTDVSADSVEDAHHTKTQPSDVDSTNWDDVEIQHNGTDGQGIFNVKTE